MANRKNRGPRIGVRFQTNQVRRKFEAIIDLFFAVITALSAKISIFPANIAVPSHICVVQHMCSLYHLPSSATTGGKGGMSGSDGR